MPPVSSTPLAARHVALAVYLACAGLACLPQSSMAQDAAAQLAAVRSYDIPAGTLTATLNRFAVEAGIFLSGAGELTAGRNTSGLTGTYSVRDGLAAILAGSGLEAVAPSTGGYALRRVAPAASSGADDATRQPVATLPRISVEAPADADGSAERGYRSEGVSAVGPWQGRKLQDTPYSITVISKELIQNLQATTPEQIYRIVPTAQVGESSYRNDEPAVNMRGFEVYIPRRDGMAGDYIGLGTTTEDVESVEILSGLSGFLYGPGNVGGLVNYVSKRPTAEALNRVTLGNNSGSNYYAQGDFGGPLDSGGRFGYRVNGIWQSGETAIDNQRIKKRFASAAFDWHVTDTLLWRFDAAYRDYETRGGPPVWILGTGTARPSAHDIDSSVSWSQPWKYSRNKMQRYGTQLRWDADETFSLRAGWLHTDTRRNPNMGSINIIQPDGTYTQRTRGLYAPGDDAFAGELENSSGQAFADINFKTGAIAHKLTVGVQYQKLGAEDFANASPGVTYTGLPFGRPTYFDEPVPAPVDRGPRDRDADQTNTTLLMGDDITFNEHWSLLAGVAHGTIDVPALTVWPNTIWSYSQPGYKKSAVTPNLSVIYEPIEAVTTYATYVEALEQGGMAGNDYNGVPVINVGEVFEPLISKQVEVGAKWAVGDMLLTMALFQIDKALQYYDVSASGSARYVQDGREAHRGIELTAFGKLTGDLTLTGGMTLLDAKVKEQKEMPALEGKHPTNVAETFAKLRAEYRLPARPALSLIGGISYTGRQYSDAMNTDRLPSYTLFDVGARYLVAVADRPLTLRLDVNNLIDKAYWNQGITLGTPRTVLFSVSAEL